MGFPPVLSKVRRAASFPPSVPAQMTLTPSTRQAAMRADEIAAHTRALA